MYVWSRPDWFLGKGIQVCEGPLGPGGNILPTMTNSRKIGREFEQLVESFERACGPGAIIKSPDRLPDLDTGQMREIDATLRGKVGSSEVLLIVECRKRGRTADVRWVEEVAQKVRSVGANGAILVATAFSRPAKDKADKLGIQHRTIAETQDPEKMGQLFHQTYTGLVTWWPRWEVTSWLPVFDKSCDLSILPRRAVAVGPSDRVFLQRPEGAMLSFSDLVVPGLRAAQNEWFKEWAVDSVRQSRTVCLQVPQGHEIALIVGDKELSVAAFNIVVEAWYEEQHESPDKAYSYVSGSGEVAKAVEHTTEVLGHSVKLRLIHALDSGLVTVSYEPTNPEHGGSIGVA